MSWKEIEKRLNDIRELVRNGRETEEGIWVDGSGDYDYIYYEIIDTKDGYADQLFGFNPEKLNHFKEKINRRKSAVGNRLLGYEYFIYDKRNKKFITVDEIE